MNAPSRAARRDRERRELRRIRRVPARRRARDVRICVTLTLGTGVGGGVVFGRQLFRALDRARPHGDRRGRRAVPGRVLRPRARRGVLLRDARSTGSRSGCSAPDATAHDLVAAAPSRARADRPPPRRRDRLARQHLRPERVVIGGGFGIAAFDQLVPAARRPCSARGARAGGQPLEIERAELGAEAGLIGAGAGRLRGGPDVVPLAVCATPIGNLDDITLRVLAELRAADVVLAEDTRHTRSLLERHGIAARLLSYHEHNEAARVAELAAAARGGRARSRSSPMPGCRSSPTRARAWCAPPSTPASRSRFCRVPPRSRRRSSRAGWRRRATRSSASCRASAGELDALWRETGGVGRAPVVAFESPQRLPASSARSLPPTRRARSPCAAS